MKQYLLKVEDDLWKKLKLKTTKNDITIKDKLIDLIESYTSQYYKWVYYFWKEKRALQKALDSSITMKGKVC